MKRKAKKRDVWQEIYRLRAEIRELKLRMEENDGFCRVNAGEIDMIYNAITDIQESADGEDWK